MQIQVKDLFSLALREKQLWRNGFGMQALEIVPKNHPGHTDWDKSLRGTYYK